MIGLLRQTLLPPSTDPSTAFPSVFPNSTNWQIHLKLSGFRAVTAFDTGNRPGGILSTDNIP
jgi:hypothetical protein